MKNENVTESDRLISAVRREYHRTDGDILPELLNDEQLARLLGSTRRQIRNWRRKRIIPSIKISYKVIKFRWRAVLAALEKREKGARR